MKRNVVALLIALLVLLSGCTKQELGQKPLEELMEKTPVSMEEGHLFFTGKVTAASVMNRMISFYEVETEKSTFYQVEVTDDPFDCMPDRILTVCILGSADSFGERNALQKDTEYLFDTSLWVQEDEAVLLLPTFYQSLPEREGDDLYYIGAEGRERVKGSYRDYLDRLQALAEENKYSAQRVLEAAEGRMKSAAERDADYFKELKFEKTDAEAILKTNKKAADLLAKVKTAEKTWEGIRELLK